MFYEIPLQPGNSHYSFTVDIADRTLEFTVKYNTVTQIWSCDIVDLTNDVTLILGQALMLGASLLEQFTWATGTLFLYDMSNTGQEAGADDLGERVKLFWDDGND